MKIESNTHAKATPAQQEAYRQLNSELLSKFERINNVTSSNQSMNSNSPAATPPTLERPVLNNGETAPVVNKNKTTTHFPLKKAILKKAKELATSKQVQNLPFFKQISSIKQIFQPKVVATTPKRHPGYIKTNILRPAAKLPEGDTPAAVPLEETTVLPSLSRRPSSASLVPLPSHTDSGFLTDNSPDPSLPTPTTISPDPDAVSLTSLSSSRTPISAEDSATFTFGLHGDEPPPEPAPDYPDYDTPPPPVPVYAERASATQNQENAITQTVENTDAMSCNDDFPNENIYDEIAESEGNSLYASSEELAPHRPNSLELYDVLTRESFVLPKELVALKWLANTKEVGSEIWDAAIDSIFTMACGGKGVSVNDAKLAENFILDVYTHKTGHEDALEIQSILEQKSLELFEIIGTRNNYVKHGEMSETNPDKTEWIMPTNLMIIAGFQTAEDQGSVVELVEKIDEAIAFKTVLNDKKTPLDKSLFATNRLIQSPELDAFTQVLNIKKEDKSIIFHDARELEINSVNNVIVAEKIKQATKNFTSNPSGGRNANFAPILLNNHWYLFGTYYDGNNNKSALVFDSQGGTNKLHEKDCFKKLAQASGVTGETLFISQDLQQNAPNACGLFTAKAMQKLADNTGRTPAKVLLDWSNEFKREPAEYQESFNRRGRAELFAMLGENITRHLGTVA